MASIDQHKLNDDTLKSLGGFVVAFSRLLFALESSTAYLISPAPANWVLIRTALSDRTAAPIVASFFSVFSQRWHGSVTPEDKKILKCLRREIDEVVTERNRLMHDAWMSKTVGGDPGPHPLGRIRLRAHRNGADWESVDYLPSVLDRLTTDAERLSTAIRTATWYCRPGQSGPELDTRLEIVDGKVISRS